MPVSKILVVLALVCFVLAFFGVKPYGDMIALGLAFWVSTNLV